MKDILFITKLYSTAPVARPKRLPGIVSSDITAARVVFQLADLEELPPGAVATIKLRFPDTTIVTRTATTIGNELSYILSEEDTATAGEILAQAIIKIGTQVICSRVYHFLVEAGARDIVGDYS